MVGIAGRGDSAILRADLEIHLHRFLEHLSHTNMLELKNNGKGTIEQPREIAEIRLGVRRFDAGRRQGIAAPGSTRKAAQSRAIDPGLKPLAEKHQSLLADFLPLWQCGRR